MPNVSPDRERKRTRFSARSPHGLRTVGLASRAGPDQSIATWASWTRHNSRMGWSADFVHLIETHEARPSVLGDIARRIGSRAIEAPGGFPRRASPCYVRWAMSAVAHRRRAVRSNEAGESLAPRGQRSSVVGAFRRSAGS